MTEDQVWAFLAASPPHTGKLATVRRGGRPHVAPIWFAVDGHSVVFTTAATSLKGRTLLRDSRAAMCVDDEQPPFGFANVEGTAELSEDPADLRRWATVIGGRYMGEDQAAAFGARNGGPGELLVRLRPRKVYGAVDIAL